MKYLILSFVLLITGCSTTVPVVAKFPAAPEILLSKCPPLTTINHETTVFSELTKTVTDNYTKYHQCSNTVDGWIDWYYEQKKILESVK